MDYATKPTDPEIVIGFATESLIYPKKKHKKNFSQLVSAFRRQKHTQKKNKHQDQRSQNQGCGSPPLICNTCNTS